MYTVHIDANASCGGAVIRRIHLSWEVCLGKPPCIMEGDLFPKVTALTPLTG
jgi:hypothetical protein